MTYRNRLRSNGIALALAGAIVAGCGLSPAQAAGPGQPLIVAHRGGASLMPENTFPAFDNAVRLGVDLLEFDMMMTADDQLIITHDGTVNATFCSAEPGSAVTAGPVRERTLAQLATFDCGSKHRDRYPDQVAVPGTHMPTPDQFFARYKNAKVMFYGETKMPGEGEGAVDPVQFARLVEASVRKYGLEDRFILQSADWRTIDAMHAINPRIRTCLLYVWREKKDYLEVAKEHHATCLLLRLQDADAAQVKRLREAGVTVYSDVVDDEAGWRAYRARGDDALFTNDPAALIAFLKKDGQAGHYLSGVGVDLLQVLPPAPERGSPRYDADRRTFRETRTLLDTPRGEQAAKDVRLDVATMLENFSPAAGRALTPRGNPALAALLQRMQPDIEAPVRAAKPIFHRQRPFYLDKGKICQPRGQVPDFDYPSGHSSWGTSVALILAELIPDRATAILARGREYGDSRYICGAHNMSAVEAGRFAAASVVARLHGDAVFRSDLDAARRELAQRDVGGVAE